MKLRSLLVHSSPKDEIEKKLKQLYLKRLKELFKKAVSLESDFNIFDEIFHGLAKTSTINENLHSFYESFLTITQYYQHSQAGRGSLAVKLLRELGETEKMEFEFVLRKLPRFLGLKEKLPDTVETRQRFDIVNKSGENLAFCELKMKVYSGCSAGRIELMDKFNKFVNLMLNNREFRDLLIRGNIKNVYLIGGILFDIEGNPATVQKDREFGICYNGLIRAKEEIMRNLKEAGVPYHITENGHPEKAFTIEFSIEDLNVRIITVYGNKVADELFLGQAKHDINYFKEKLEGMLYDDLWLGQIIALSERAILEQMFKTNKERANFLLAIAGDENCLKILESLGSDFDEIALQEATLKILELLKIAHPMLFEISPTPAQSMMTTGWKDYDLQNYVADIVQFLSSEDLLKVVKEKMVH
ncbi:MAG: hypothetical protein ACPLPS_07850 [bacterium]